MATYGKIYQFSIKAQNGEDVDIFISKKGYTGAVHRRPLGRAPILRRERNGCILGSSLEIYAECRVDGEFAQLYTSSADEFLVEVYRNNFMQWSGFVTPELYSEPDIAPPYDVQIIATDGLGELKNHGFIQEGGPKSYREHLEAILAHTGLSLGLGTVSDLQYQDSEDGWSANNDLLSIVVDLSHREKDDCYEVLQDLLTSVNACILRDNSQWHIIRESDLHNHIGQLIAAELGSATHCDWWPIGNLSTDILPAKKFIELRSENSYKDSVLENSWMQEDNAWEKEFDAVYDESEQAYRLPRQYSGINQAVEFNAEVGYRLLLHISARNIGSGEDAQKLGVIVRIDGRMYMAGSEFWLVQGTRSKSGYAWKAEEGTLEIELPAPSYSDTKSDADDIDIVIPLYKYDNRAYAYATSVDVTLYNLTGNYAIAIYECSLSQYERSQGHEIAVNIANNAREADSDVDLMLNDGDYTAPGADVFRNAIPLAQNGEIIKTWRTSTAEGSYLPVMAKDYAMQVALPRMRYKGKVNVPDMTWPVIPLLFVRDDTYYFLNTFSLDMLLSELEVELISIPNAIVELESEIVTELPSGGSGSNTGGGGVSGGGDSDIVVDTAMSSTSTNPVQNKVIKAYVDARSMIHLQPSASDTWVIEHNMNRYPSVTVVDSAGTEVIGEKIYNSENQVTLKFSSPFAGKAYLN
jgi:hypothetical protein